MKRINHTLILLMVILFTLACSLTPLTTATASRPCHSQYCRFQARRAVVQVWKFEVSPEVDGGKMWNGMEK